MCYGGDYGVVFDVMCCIYCCFIYCYLCWVGEVVVVGDKFKYFVLLFDGIICLNNFWC